MKIIKSLCKDFMIKKNLPFFGSQFFRTKYSSAVVNGLNIKYQTTGIGQDVAIFLPGALGCGDTDFSSQIKGLKESALKIYYIDPPGYGKSRPPDRTYCIDFFKKDADVAMKLMSSLGHSKYSVLGWSDGGITAIQLALSYPEQVEKMIIWGGNGYLKEQDLALYEKVKDVDKWSEKMRKPMIDMYGYDYFKSTWAKWVEAMTRIYREKNGVLYDRDISEITCPTLIIHGMKDAMLPVEQAKFLNEKIKNSKLICWENGKHNLHIRYAEEFNNIVLDFLLK